MGPRYLQDLISPYEPTQFLKPIRGVSLDSTTLTSVLAGDTGEGLLCCCSQALEFPPMGDQAGPIFAVFLQADKYLFLAVMLSLSDWLSKRDFKIG